MDIPEPIPGLVIRYSFLWHSEFVTGRDEGSKDRPVAIVAAIRVEEGRRVIVLPVTHTLPSDASLSIEIPVQVKHRLGLDAERSWIVLSEANEFQWPGPDLRPTRSGGRASAAYGVLPPKLYERIRRAFAAAIKAGRVNRVSRTE